MHLSDAGRFCLFDVLSLKAGQTHFALAKCVGKVGLNFSIVDEKRGAACAGAVLCMLGESSTFHEINTKHQELHLSSFPLPTGLERDTSCCLQGLLESSIRRIAALRDMRKHWKMIAIPVSMRKKTVADAPQCSLCKLSLDYVERCLMNRTAAQVMYRVSEICELFPADIEQSCRLATDKNANIIYNGLKYHSDPATLCNIMTLCPHAPTPEGREFPEVPWGKGCDFGKENEP